MTSHHPNSPGPTPPSQSFSIPLRPQDTTTAAKKVENDWECEYSATETETYYLTVDLSMPTTDTSQQGHGTRSRSGYRVRWMTPGLSKKRKRKLSRPPTIALPNMSDDDSNTLVRMLARSGERGDSDVENEDSEDSEGGESEHFAEQSQEFEEEPPNMAGARPDETFSRDGSKDTSSPAPWPDMSKELDKIQILELHSDNPLISYKHHTFSCSWAENIGTELLFTNHDPNNPLPTLRTLSDGVDLLAASSARLVSTPSTVVPKYQPGAQRQSPDKLPRSVGYMVPKGRGGGRFRQDQSRFLERMQAIKASKNESDEVTVYAIKRQTHQAWSKEFAQKRNDERAKAHEMMKRGGRWAEEAMAKLEEINRAEREIQEKIEKDRADKKAEKERGEGSDGIDGGPPKRMRGKRGFVNGNGEKSRLVRPRRGVGRPSPGRNGRDALSGPILPSKHPNSQGMLSTPTPQTWDHLKTGTTDSTRDTPLSR